MSQRNLSIPVIEALWAYTPRQLLSALQTHPLRSTLVSDEVGTDWTADDQVWVVAFSKYHRDNLLQLMNAIGWPDAKLADPDLARYNTGDWNGEIPWRLRKNGRRLAPVLDPDDMPNPIGPRRG